MPRKQKKYHFMYKTTNIITKRFYVGMHSTNNLDDEYLGSGKFLWYSLNKYGRENHKIERFEFFETREELRNREAEIVNENLLKDPLCMNLTFGGYGNWSFLNSNSDIQRKKAIKANEKMSWLRENNPAWNKKISENISNGNKLAYKNGRITNPPDWTGKKHSEETKERMRQVDRTGVKNSQSGTCWITNGKENKKIKKENIIPNGWKLGRKLPL